MCCVFSDLLNIIFLVTEYLTYFNIYIYIWFSLQAVARHWTLQVAQHLYARRYLTSSIQAYVHTLFAFFICFICLTAARALPFLSPLSSLSPILTLLSFQNLIYLLTGVPFERPRGAAAVLAPAC